MKMLTAIIGILLIYIISFNIYTYNKFSSLNKDIIDLNKIVIELTEKEIKISTPSLYTKTDIQRLITLCKAIKRGK